MAINWKKINVPGAQENPCNDEKERMKKSKAGYIGGHKRRTRRG
ncbi:hypothetical protein ACSAZL_01225 [Methanosarcina sp. T3]